MKVLTSSKTHEWYTPRYIIKRARDTMGGIDLDPASSPEANGLVDATYFYTIEDDGLSRVWFDNVWLNPPYGKTGNRSNQDIWARYLEDEYQMGRVTQACLLTKCVPGYRWWERLFRKWPVCFIEERVSFINAASGKKGKAKAGTNIWYLGPNAERFHEEFQDLGRIIYPETR